MRERKKLGERVEVVVQKGFACDVECMLVHMHGIGQIYLKLSAFRENNLGLLW